MLAVPSLQLPPLEQPTSNRAQQVLQRQSSSVLSTSPVSTSSPARVHYLPGAAALALVLAAQRSSPRRRRRGAARRRASAFPAWAQPQFVDVNNAAAVASSFTGNAQASAPGVYSAHSMQPGPTALLAGVDPSAVDAAVAVGRDAAKKMRRKLTPQAKKQLRDQEIRKKINLLKGGTPAQRYKAKRDKEKQEAAAKQMESGADSEDGEEHAAEDGEDGVEESDGGGEAGTLEAGEAQEDWIFERKEGNTARIKVQGEDRVSEDSRAVAVAELEGEGGSASSEQILEAAKEFSWASQHQQVLDLAEVARKRIDREQLDRKITALEAQDKDNRALWFIAEAAEAQGTMARLMRAVATYAELKELLQGIEQQKAESQWARASANLAEKHFNANDFNEALKVQDLVVSTSKRTVVGNREWDRLHLDMAMTYQRLNRMEEAKLMAQYMRKNATSKEAKNQATFLLDVFSVDTSGERNEEFHKLWDEHFVLPTDSYAAGGQVRVRTGSNLQLSDNEKEWRSWVSKYWEDRMKGPVYYSFLTLWVTWPFAIPVISILKKNPQFAQFL